jgi:MFS-type transporter involved in bile tolerance (Atg22 family)
MVWTAYTTSAGAWYIHRILIGLFIAPVESLPEVSIPDLFFAHERGNFMGLYAL